MVTDCTLPRTLLSCIERGTPYEKNDQQNTENILLSSTQFFFKLSKGKYKNSVKEKQ